MPGRLTSPPPPPPGRPAPPQRLPAPPESAKGAFWPQSTQGQDAPAPLRFRLLTHVICKVGPDCWAPGKVQAVHEPTDEGVLPYVVKLDRSSRLISVPHDEDSVVRRECCFRNAVLARGCVAPGIVKSRSPLRFKVGDRVACLSESFDGQVAWVPGSVRELWCSSGGDDNRLALPYLVACDDSAELLCHRDTHDLIRELQLQPAGPAPLAGSKRFFKRWQEADGGWEHIDHMTRRIRRCASPPEDD